MLHQREKQEEKNVLAHHIRLLIDASTEQEKMLKELGVVRWMR